MNFAGRGVTACSTEWITPYRPKSGSRSGDRVCWPICTFRESITEEGALYWLDGIGNRVAAIAFGPRKVLLVAGRNKIVATRAAAEARIRDIAAPRNVARLGQKTPCAVTGVCADCDSEGRICNTHLRMERCFPRKRITVILIDEEMGL